MSNWTAENIPDQEGRKVVVTGSSSGIGEEAALVLAGKGAAVIIAVRNPEKGEAAQELLAGKHSLGISNSGRGA